MFSLALALIIISIYNYKQQKLFERVLKYQEKIHYIIGYLLMFYLLIMLKEVIGFPSISNWQRVLNVQGNIFDPNISLIPFVNGILHSDYLNVVMFIPLGFFLPLMWRKYHNGFETIKFGFYLSLFIELSQLFTRFRATDINDLITNTIGAAVGWSIYFVFSKLLLRKIEPIPLFQSSKFLKYEPQLYVVIAAVASFLS
ncbi:VanZ family protein [Vagococcus fluvialis]|uniref:VanZ family protein n=1 Tax=Vagococcus fluvialis TaxID=2738 RepID=A0A7X6I2X9_9ENTE|nr:VanZ family protein [Vagococcus fluvialis]MBO0419148.1 VanZ family protein [Vagococcus fluvialis]MBO0485904.1 VanZ family protein [Vagococcus fluvialis]NKC60122.1 VanZ family protein [Vagococcus fluvialis]NKC67931.1 VanZ family protein [Vagococcus fluvialis]NKD50827.1 VanZ family protein [Vagococcus fluvialis]